MSKLTEQELIELTVVYGNRHNACIAAKELLEARAELAAIKGEQQPIGQVIFGGYNSDGTCDANVVCLHEQADWDNFADGTLLYFNPAPKE